MVEIIKSDQRVRGQLKTVGDMAVKFLEQIIHSKAVTKSRKMNSEIRVDFEY